MNKISAKLLIFCLTLIAFEASAADGGYYVELGTGLSNGYVPSGGELPSGRYSGASVYSFAAGKQFNENIAIDLEVSHRGDFTNNDHNFQTNGGTEEADASISSLSAMLNGYYYYYNKQLAFRPYITAGIGASRNKTNNMVISGLSKPFSQVVDGRANTSFAWKLGVGIKYELDRHFEADFRYQFVNLGNTELGNSESTYHDNQYLYSQPIALPSNRLQSHEILIGIVYKF